MSTSPPRTALLGSLLAGAFLLSPLAVPAAAASGITSPGDGEIVAEHAVVPVRAAVDGPGVTPSELSLLAPGATTAEVVAVQSSPRGGELAYDFDTACSTRVCSGRAPAVNGTWTVRLTGSASDERAFVLRIPPARPTVLDASRAEAGAVVRWRLGDEPDLTGYAVEGPDGRVVRGDVDLSACDPQGTCSVVVPEQAGPWTVRAFRAECPGCSGVLASVASEPVALGSAAPVAGLPVPPGGVTAPGQAPSSAAAPARRGPDQRTAFASAFGDVRPRPPSSAAAPGAAAPLVPETGGAYDVRLGYAPPSAAVPQPTLGRAQDAAGQLLNADPRLVLLSLAMVGAALWLRRWARRAIAE